MTTHSRFSVTDYRGKIWDNRISAAPKPNPAGGIAAERQTFVTVALGSVADVGRRRDKEYWNRGTQWGMYSV
jgi:hypothetical protein